MSEKDPPKTTEKSASEDKEYCAAQIIYYAYVTFFPEIIATKERVEIINSIRVLDIRLLLKVQSNRCTLENHTAPTHLPQGVAIIMYPLYALGSILLVWSICFSACIAEPEPIRGGNVDIEDEAIWTVSIQRMMNGTWTHACGGSLISERDIITAAHCFVRFACKTTIGKFPNIYRDLKKEQFRVVIGLKDLTLKDFIPGRGIERKIRRVFIHKDYERRGSLLINDLAVIRLKNPVDDEEKEINPKNIFGFIPLFRTDKACNKDSCIDREAFGAGFGVINIKEDGTMERDGLRKILKVHFTDKGNISYPSLKLVHYNYDAPTVQGFCTGDSGGPLYFKNGSKDFQLVGVLSTGPCDCDLRLTSGRTEKVTFIPDYLDFLESIRNVDESQISKQKSLEAYEKTGAMYFVLPDHNMIAKLKYFNKTEFTAA